MFKSKWIYFVSKRISHVDRKGRTAVTSWLASLGICFGVMALIVVMSVMNGFQLNFIESILEISSFHVQTENINESQAENLLEYSLSQPHVRSAFLFKDAQGLAVSADGIQNACLLRSVSEDFIKNDSGVKNEMKCIAGKLEFTEDNSILMGYSLARALNVRVGNEIGLFILPPSTSKGILSAKKNFKITGIFNCGYSDINSSYCFINLDGQNSVSDASLPLKLGVKFSNKDFDSSFIKNASREFPQVKFSSWKEYNRSFFGVLRLEKNLLFLLVFLIFIVVAVNIYNSMKKLVYERKEEIAVFSALGAGRGQIQSIFIMQGFRTGLFGAVPGLLFAILICKNMKSIFMFFEHLTSNPMFAVYASIPARMIPMEVFMIFMFGLCSAFAASFFVSRKVLDVTVSEVLRNE